jgi:hypothetical protein
MTIGSFAKAAGGRVLAGQTQTMHEFHPHEL